jgi:PAS domain S-box-containing protein
MVRMTAKAKVAPMPPTNDDLFHHLVDGARDYAICALDLGGRVTSWNAGAERLTGYRSAEIMDRHFSLFYPAAEREQGSPSRALANASRAGRFEEEAWRLRKDGSPFRASVVISTIHDERGNPAGFAQVTRDLTERSARPLVDRSGAVTGSVAITHDISDRKRVEGELASQQVLLQSVLDCVADMVAVFDVTGKMVFSNPAFDKIVGKRFGGGSPVEERLDHYQLLDADGSRRLSPEEIPARRALRGETVEDLAVVVRTTGPDHGINDVIVSTHARRLHDASGAVVGVVVSGRDVTSRTLADRKMLRQTRLLS